MTIDSDEDYPALPQAGQTAGNLEIEVLNLLKREIKLEMREMEIYGQEMTKKMQETGQEMFQKMCQEMCQEMYQQMCQDMYQKMYQEMYQKMQEKYEEMYQKMQEKYQEMYQKMQERYREMYQKKQENVNPRTSLDNQDTGSKGKLQLLFVNELHDVIFTLDKIRDRHGGYVKIKLINTKDGLTVKKGHLSSTEIEIVVLQGDFGFGSNENWTNEAFNTKIINTKPDTEQQLVEGKVKIKLTDGVGTIEDLSFCVNSNWTSNKKFRLGARAIGMGTGVIIKEARSKAFAVRLHSTKVAHLRDLENGGKFHATLIANGILTKSDVQLKRMYKINSDVLRREIFKGCSIQQWEAFVQHIIRIEDDDNPNHLRIPDMQQPVVACNIATTGPPLHQGVQNNSNRASSSQHYCAFQQPENLQEPQAMATSPTHVRAQLENSNDIHQTLNNGDSFPGNNFRDLGNENAITVDFVSQFGVEPVNGDSFFPSMSTNHMAQSAAPGPLDENFVGRSNDPMNESNNHGYFVNVPAMSSSLMITTGPPLHQGVQNNSNRASSSQHYCAFQQSENLQEPQAMATSPTHVRAQLENSNDIHKPPNNGNSFQINDLPDLGNFSPDDLFNFARDDVCNGQNGIYMFSN